MNRADAWYDANNDYLGAALRWLRSRLMLVAEPGTPGAPAETRAPVDSAAAAPTEPLGPIDDVPVAGPTGRSFRFGRRRRPSPAPAAAHRPAPSPTLPPPASPPRSAPAPSNTADERAAAAAMAELERGDHLPALVAVAELFGLSRFERDVLLLCAAMELDTRVPPLCARAQGDRALRYPTFTLAITLFDDPVWESLGPGAPLRRYHLVDVATDAGLPLTASPLRADEQVVNAVKGLLHHDERLAPYVGGRFAGPEDHLPDSQQAVADGLLAQLGVLPDDRRAVVHLVGADVESKVLVARHVAAAANPRRLLTRVPVAALPAHPADLEQLARVFERDTLLVPQALYIDAFDHADGPPGPDGPTAILQRVLPRLGGLVFVDTRDVLADLDVPTLTVEVTSPSTSEQAHEWRAGLGDPAADIATHLAGQFNLAAPTIRRIGAFARGATPPGAPLTELQDRAWQACRLATRPGLDRLAERIEPRARWDDLVLPDEPLAALRAVCQQVRQRGRVYGEWHMAEVLNRGLGIAALFSGESGTGKTMAAEVLASDLDLNLYRVDLSAVVSKYIGETEKNLARVFDAAEQGGTILLFDEADALFGKRSEVKDSHDRYANIEINYLLQRMEAYQGLAILATNARSALDKAFARRLRFVVTFPFPGPAQRAEIWRRSFPSSVPTADLDIDRLARLGLTGGSIANVALNAMFAAAASPAGVVTMPLVIDAARREYRKLQLPINEADVVWTTRDPRARTTEPAASERVA